MIKEIVLYGDNSDLLQKITENLFESAPIDNIKVSISVKEQIDLSTVRSDQAYIYLSGDQKMTTKVIQRINPDQIAYAASKIEADFLANAGHVQTIGNQRHLSTDATSYVNLNLGILRNKISICEPAIRDSDLFLLDLNVLRASEINDSFLSYPSGLYSEDVTQMCRYAGMSELTKYLIINNARESETTLLTQLIWYFAEAAALRFPDHPYFSNTVEEYVVEVTSFGTMLSFYKSKTSGRWWVKIPDIPENKWKSCSYEDYNNACNDNISADLLRTIAISEES